MSARFCQDCGTPAEPGAAFCASCGARLAAVPDGRPAGAPVPVPSGPARSRKGSRLPFAIATVAVVAAAVAGGALLIERLDSGSPADAMPAATAAGGAGAAPVVSGATPGQEGTSAPQATAATVPEVTSALEATAAASPATEPFGSPTDQTPEAAIAALVEANGLRFAGTCPSGAVAEEDVGAWCSQLVEDRGASQVHRLGLVGSEPDTWLLVGVSGPGWLVLEVAPIDDPSAGPPF